MVFDVGATAKGGASAGSLRLGFNPFELWGQLLGLTGGSKAPELLMNLPPIDLADIVRDL